jgi:hypothetical protein
MLQTIASAVVVYALGHFIHMKPFDTIMDICSGSFHYIYENTNISNPNLLSLFLFVFVAITYTFMWFIATAVIIHILFKYPGIKINSHTI